MQRRLADSHGTEKGFLLQAIREKALSLQQLLDWCSDRDVVLAAVQQNGCALRFAPVFQADKGIVAAALHNDVFALVFVAAEAKDKTTLLPALQQRVARLRKWRSDLLDVEQIRDLIQESVFLANEAWVLLSAEEGLAMETLALAPFVRCSEIFECMAV